MNEQQYDALRSLLGSDGWSILCKDFREKEHVLMECLVTLTDAVEVQRIQAQIMALRRVMNRPKELLQGGTNADETGKNGG